MDYREELITTPDGRTLEVATVGDPAGATVFFHHGSPGSATLVRMMAPLARAATLFVVTMSRPGYARSSRLAGRRVASVVDDVRAALDALERTDYVAVGWSGGGPHALACAALDAPRCRAAWSLAGVAPVDVGFDWTEGMGPENVEEFALAREGGPRYEEFMARAAEAFAAADADNVVALFGGLLSDPDKAAFETEEARTRMADSCRDAFSTGWRGFFDDDQAMLSPWGFELAAMRTPVHLWFGDHDLMVPPAHGRYLASAIPGATASHFPHEGHISIVVNHFDELARDVAAAAQRG